MTAAAPLTATDTLTARRDGPGVAIEARKRVDPDELYLRGHFPGFVIYPGVFLIESLDQAVRQGFAQLGFAPPRLVSVDSARFLAPLLAGDEFTLQVQTGPPAGAVTVRGTAYRPDGSVAARLTAGYRAGPADD
ncbi:MAG TPA: hypothetical protein VJT31_15495 [Rugosimonospora sp.]|nr:hypothetical protein [Rugosimonospora sp.]